MSLRFNGVLMMTEELPFNESMISAIADMDIELVRKALDIFSSMNLIERLDNGTIYMTNIQAYIGKSSNEGDRLRAYREKIEKEKLLINKRKNDVQMSQEPSGDIRENEVQVSYKCTPEKRDKIIDIRDKSLKFINKERENREEMNLDSLSQTLVNYLHSIAGYRGKIPLAALKSSISRHGFDYVRMAIDKALENNKLTMNYINGILRNWADEGYPMKGDALRDGSTGENNEADSPEERKWGTDEEDILTDEERNEISKKLI